MHDASAEAPAPGQARPATSETRSGVNGDRRVGWERQLQAAAAATVMLAPAHVCRCGLREEIAVDTPAARPVTMDAVTAALSRLIATNPLSPRENAIAFAPLSHQ